jgi:hypothetical protein
MSSTAIAKLSQVSSKVVAPVSLSKTVRKALNDYVAAGKTISTADAILLETISETPGMTVSEYVSVLTPRGTSRKECIILATRFNRLLRTTGLGRSLTTTGKVALTPVSGKPYWFLDIMFAIGIDDARAVVPTRSPQVQVPEIKFQRGLPVALKTEARATLGSWLATGGIGTRWRSQDVVRAVQADVKTALAQVAREHALALSITNTAQPMITHLVEATVRKMVADQTLTSASATANAIAA